MNFLKTAILIPSIDSGGCMAVFVIVGGGEHGGTLSLPRRGIAHGAGDRAYSDGGKKPIRKDDNSSTLR